MNRRREMNQEQLAPKYDKLVLHTSDMIGFKRCRRRWELSSPWRRNLTPKEKDKSINLWFGSGFHFALEDFHGYNKFGNPMVALEAYYNAFKSDELPEGAEDVVGLGMGMLEYYLEWNQHRERFETLWIDGKPMVEISFELEVPTLSSHAQSLGVASQVTYHGTIDKIVYDEEGRWWLVDYKTAKTMDIKKLSTDPQISAYLWAAEQYFGHPFAGMLFMQFLKEVPHGPKRLAKGGFSTDKRQKTPHNYYRNALMAEYGTIPSSYIEILNELATNESPEGNQFIRIDKVERTHYNRDSTYWNIVNEGMDMLEQIAGPRTYPNFTRDCAWDCAFRFPCIALEEGHEAEDLLTDNYEQRNKSEKGEEAPWRKNLKWPEEGGEE